MAETLASGVSLVVPCFNHGRTLGRAVSSALDQTALAELIIVDDGSSDDSLAIARGLARADARIRVLTTKKNGGPGAARNLGARHASGAYLCFLDADDELIGNFFAEALDMMARAADMRAIRPVQEYFDPVKGYVLPEFDPRHTSAALSSAAGLVIEKQAFFRLGGFPEDPVFRGEMGGEDVAFMQAVIEHLQPLGRIDHPCYRVWSSAGSHLDRFLANTRLTNDGFEFVKLHPDQLPNGVLSQALSRYLAAVRANMANSSRLAW
jgi:glycosyltransferase involved in cell wall biosynthesis